MYRQAVHAHNLITANSTETLPFTKEILLVWKVVSEKTIHHFYKPGYYNPPSLIYKSENA